MNKRLERELFKTIVEHTPLISINLIIRNDKGEALLGQRLNRPAQNYWFVPGGRIYKDESFEIAFKRITFEEVGVQISLNDALFLGVYEHFYNDNFSEAEFSTHYVVCMDMKSNLNLSNFTYQRSSIIPTSGLM